jgi:surfactin synthase thioesterase subunit
MSRPAPSLVIGESDFRADTRWLKRYARRDTSADVRLLCFHHAGGSAGTFRHWPEQMTPAVEPIAVQLPGRADRFNEPPFKRFAPLVEALVDAVTPLVDQPYAFYGVSMGATVAWSLALALHERALPGPVQLFVACNPAPVHRSRSPEWENWPGGLVGYLRDMGGTPQEVLADTDLMRAVLIPTLRADLTALTTIPARPHPPLDVPIRAFAGTDDVTAPPHRMLDWQTETSAGFALSLIPGGHFFSPAGELQTIRLIGDDLRRRSREASARDR